MQLPVEILHEDPGAAPGIEHDEISAHHHSSTTPAQITCIDYCPTNIIIQVVSELEEFLAHHRPDWSLVRWINIDGLQDMPAIQSLAAKYDLHPLAIEDLIHAEQRPKIEAYGGDETEMLARLFIVAHSPYLDGGHLKHSQVSIFLGHKTVLTFLENASDAWDPIRQRLRAKGSRLRRSDASFLAYSLLDALVDRCFPILEHFSDRAEELETQILSDAQRGTINAIHQFKRELLFLRWAIWPLREVISTLQRDEHECVSDTTRIYLRDLYDHVIQIIEIIETYRETASDLTETYMTSISNRMNEVMKVLTLIGTIFIPLTFLAGVYGMNFHYFPELDQPWAYPVFWLVCAVLTLVMLALFRKRNWL
jgi:magnesium transporter